MLILRFRFSHQAECHFGACDIAGAPPIVGYKSCGAINASNASHTVIKYSCARQFSQLERSGKKYSCQVEFISIAVMLKPAVLNTLNKAEFVDSMTELAIVF